MAGTGVVTTRQVAGAAVEVAVGRPGCRDAELVAVGAALRLAAIRLMTLTGPGGVGKSARRDWRSNSPTRPSPISPVVP